MKLYLVADDEEDGICEEDDIKHLTSAQEMADVLERYNLQHDCVIEYELVQKRCIPKHEFLKEYHASLQEPPAETGGEQ